MNTQDKSRRAAPRRRPSASNTARRRPPQQRQSARRRPTQQRPTQQRPTRRRRRAPDVVYTPAKPFNRNRFLLQLATVAAVVIAVLFGISIFFKVKNITVSGAERYSAWTVREASGIKEGENLMTFGRTKASSQIKMALPYVDEVRIGIKLPDTVNIEIVELDVVYAIEAEDDTWWLMTAEGGVVEKTDAAAAKDYTQILGVQLSSPQAGQTAQVTDTAQQTTLPETTAPETTAASDETTPSDAADTPESLDPQVVFTNTERLSAVLEILQALEENEILGQIASVDVTDLSDVLLWYGEQYQVELGSSDKLAHKIKCLKQAVDQMGSHQSGVLDISFTIWTDQVGYTPF